MYAMPGPSIELCVHLAFDAEAGRWHVARSDVPGLRLEADDAATLLRRIEEAAPELIALDGAEIAERFGGGGVAAVRPVFDSPIELAA